MASGLDNGPMARKRAAIPAQDETRPEWREVPDTYRALVIRNRADAQFLAIEQQNARLVTYCQTMKAAGGLLAISSADRSRGLSDMDFFLLSIRRFHRVGELIRRSQLPTASLRPLLKRFDAIAGPGSTAATVRDVLEHLDEVAVEGRGGVGIGIGEDRLSVSYAGNSIDTFELYEAAEELHAAIRSAVDPIAILDVHGGYPIIGLTGRQVSGTTEPEGSFHP